MRNVKPGRHECAQPDLLRRARSHHRAGRLNAADKLYRDVLQRQPNNAEALHYRGLLAVQRGNGALAVELLTRSVALAPLRHDFHNNFAAVLAAAEREEDALSLLDEAIRIKPDYAPAFCNKGIVLAKLGRTAEVIEAFERALALKPADGKAHLRLGALLLKEKQIEDAAAHLREAVRLMSKSAEAHCSLGDALRMLGDTPGAVAEYRRAAELRPGWCEARCCLGAALHESGQIDEAIVELERAVEIKPQHAPAHWNLALALLASGDFERGWAEYEWRKRLKEYSPLDRPFVQPAWNGCSLKGRTILVVCEQGLGDTIQFIRYVQLLLERGAKVVVECQPRLRRLLEMLNRGGEGENGREGEGESGRREDVKIIERGEPLPRFDTHVWLMSLPGIFQTTADTVPGQVPYLSVDDKRVAKLGEQLLSPSTVPELPESPTPFRIGIAWQGQKDYHADRVRSVPLKEFAPLANVPGVRLFSLQKGEGTEQIKDAGFAIHEFDPPLDESGAFVDTAAVMKSLDLVITSDTSIAHLAGALGVPVWVALAHAPDWRWMTGRGDSSWYPTMRLFRQKKPGDWSELFGLIVDELREATSHASDQCHLRI